MAITVKDPNKSAEEAMRDFRRHHLFYMAFFSVSVVFVVVTVILSLFMAWGQ